MPVMVFLSGDELLSRIAILRTLIEVFGQIFRLGIGGCLFTGKILLYLIYATLAFVFSSNQTIDTLRFFAVFENLK